MTLEIQFGGLHTVISGGQTGADQGGLLAAWRANVRTGGTAPASFRTQDGFNPVLEVLGLTASGDFASRTKANIQNSDGTAVIAYNMASRGTVLTITNCVQAQKPYVLLPIGRIVELSYNSPEESTEDVLQEVVRLGTELAEFVQKQHIGTLNVAGNREMRSSGVPQGTMVVTSAADWIVGIALELLDLDGKLIRIEK